MAALSEIEDPELPLSIVDLGLVYDARLEGSRAEVTITLTSLGCPAQELLMAAIRSRLRELPGVDEVAVKLVWSPPWTKAKLTDDGRLQLRSLGIAV